MVVVACWSRNQKLIMRPAPCMVPFAGRQWRRHGWSFEVFMAPGDLPETGQLLLA